MVVIDLNTGQEETTEREEIGSEDEAAKIWKAIIDNRKLDPRQLVKQLQIIRNL